MPRDELTIAVEDFARALEHLIRTAEKRLQAPPPVPQPPPAMANPDPGRRAWRVDDLSKAIGLSKSTLYSAMGDGRLRSIKVAGRRLIPADAVDEFLNAPR
jgi:excisionase family DNA binding protein